jgi:mono/diheme cytochrome c family protein
MSLELTMKNAHIVIQTVFATLAALAVAGLLGAAAFIYAGVFDVAATKHHTALSFYVLHYAMERSVKARVHYIVPPKDLGDGQRIASGMALYKEHCAKCHGGPGVGPEAIALSMRPEPPNLVEPGRDWPDREIYWVIKHGVKMSGMPGWEYRLSEREMWDLTAFTKAMHTISPLDYKRDAPAPQKPPVMTSVVAAAPTPPQGGNPKAGRYAIYQYMCATCHVIPGIVGADKNVGPDLSDIARRRYIGGVLLNTPDNMVRWLEDPQAIDPQSAMPNLQVKEKDARDIAAYLYTLDKK